MKIDNALKLAAEHGEIRPLGDEQYTVGIPPTHIALFSTSLAGKVRR
jgi:hypothetical protein